MRQMRPQVFVTTYLAVALIVVIALALFITSVQS